MELIRCIKYSILLYIQNCILATNYAEENTDMSLTSIGNNTYNIEYDDNWVDIFDRGEYAGQGEGRGLVYFNTPTILSNYSCSFVNEQTRMVTVYDDVDTVVSGCRINYKKGQIVYDGPQIPSTIDYYWNYVSTIDGWPHEDLPQLPIVSVLEQDFDTVGIQLGGGDKTRQSWHIELFANNKGERDDLRSIIYDGLNLRSCPLYAFSKGIPLDKNGFFNNNFDSSLIQNRSNIQFLDVKTSITGLPDWGFWQTETVNKFRASINFSTQVYYG